MPDIPRLAENFVTAIKDRDSFPPESPQWESENAKADEIIQKVPKDKINEFSNIVNQRHHW